MVILSRDDYPAMVEKLTDIEEDAVDLAIALKRGSDLESGRDERLRECSACSCSWDSPL